MPYDPTCPFCRVVRDRTDDARIVLEDECCVAFLDARPLFPGHCLLVPRPHVSTLPDLPSTQVGPLFEAARRLCVAVRAAVGADGTFVAVNNVVSQSVPHLHVHVVPRWFHDGLKGFFWPRHGYESPQHAVEVAQAVRRALAEQ